MDELLRLRGWSAKGTAGRKAPGVERTPYFQRRLQDDILRGPAMRKRHLRLPAVIPGLFRDQRHRFLLIAAADKKFALGICFRFPIRLPFDLHEHAGQRFALLIGDPTVNAT